MGLAASQARLLSITARMHDVELESQNIMLKKTALATQQDALYEEYCNALDAKKIKVAVTGDSGTLNYIDATYETVCGYLEGRKGNYALMTADSGEMVVDDDVYEVYQGYNFQDKYAFAFAMLGFDPANFNYLLDGDPDSGTSSDATALGITIYQNVNEGDLDGYVQDEVAADEGRAGAFIDEKTGVCVSWMLMSDVEAVVYENHQEELSDYMKKFTEAVNKEHPDRSEVQKALNNFRNALYNKYSREIFAELADNAKMDDAGELDTKEFNYYVQLFEGIKAAGGCVPISKYSKGTSTDNDWFSNVLKTGELLLNQYNTGANKGWQTITPETCSNFQEVPDEVAIKKAEAKYQRELAKINAKDKRYDQDLKNLETERTALDKQMESIKKVKDDNIERTFGIFS